ILPIIDREKDRGRRHRSFSDSVRSRSSYRKFADLYGPKPNKRVRETPARPWTDPLAVRFVLLAAFVTHIVATIQLAHENRLAKPQKYAVPGYQRSTLASRTMIISGLIVLCFVIYHLLQFTLHVTDPEFHKLHDSLGRPDVYRMLILGFRHPLVSFFYVLALFLLASHLSHGFESVTQTLGINNRRISG